MKMKTMSPVEIMQKKTYNKKNKIRLIYKNKTVKARTVATSKKKLHMITF